MENELFTIDYKQFKTKLKEMKHNKIVGVGQRMKIDLIKRIDLIKVSKCGIDREFFKFFVQMRTVTNRDMIHPMDLGTTKLSKIEAIFDSKTEKTRYSKMMKYIHLDMKRFLFRYDYYGKFEQIQELFDKIADKYESIVKSENKKKRVINDIKE